MSRPALIGLLVQVLSFVAASVLVRSVGLPPWLIVLVAPLFAVVLAWRLRQPVWWFGIHALFVPVVCAALALQWPPYVYLVAFLLAWAIFGRVDKSRVPLYLSNQAALAVLSQRIPEGASVLDVGAGVGTVVRYLAQRADLRLTGVEHAWLPWLFGWIRCRSMRNKPSMLRQDLLKTSLAEYDVVYAFLSPAMMPELWKKASREMKTGSVLISNSFEIPGVPPHETIDLNDWKGARLLLWRMP